MAHYDTKTKPALQLVARRFRRPFTLHLQECKAAVDAAAAAGATPNEITDAVGGTAAWNRFVRAVRKAAPPTTNTEEH